MRAAAVPCWRRSLAVSSSVAQVSTEGPPKSIILPNYDMVRIGQLEAIESGAVIAQVSGPLANVYNPAGLAASAKTAVNASSTGYQLHPLGLEGFGDRGVQQQDREPRRLSWRRARRPRDEVDKWRLGFSVYSPLSWEPGILSGAELATVDGAVRNIDYRSQVRLRAHVPSIGAGLRLSDKFRVGAAFQVPIIDILQQQSISSLIFAPTDAGQFSRVMPPMAAPGMCGDLRPPVGCRLRHLAGPQCGDADRAPLGQLLLPGQRDGVVRRGLLCGHVS